jgi:hypothetical protein
MNKLVYIAPQTYDNMRTLLALFALLLLPLSAEAQTKDSLIITMKNGQTMMIDLDDIEKITFEQVAAVNTPTETQAPPQVTTYPNPTKGSTTIEFGVGSRQEIKIEIVNEAGVVIRTFTATRDRGLTNVEWNGLQDDGTRAPAGSYICSIHKADEVLTGKLIIAR